MIRALLIVIALAGCGHPVSDKPWTMKNLSDTIERERQAQETLR